MNQTETYAKLIDLSKQLDLNKLHVRGLLKSLASSLSVDIAYAHFEKLILDVSLVKIPSVWKAVQHHRHETSYSAFALSNMSKLVWDSLQKKYHIGDLFDDEILSYKRGMLKPDLETLKLALKQSHRRAAECTFLDDSDANIAAASSLGL